jgi:hypothetical protein
MAINERVRAPSSLRAPSLENTEDFPEQSYTNSLEPMPSPIKTISAVALAALAIVAAAKVFNRGKDR